MEAVRRLGRLRMGRLVMVSLAEKKKHVYFDHHGARSRPCSSPHNMLAHAPVCRYCYADMHGACRGVFMWQFADIAHFQALLDTRSVSVSWVAVLLTAGV